MCKKCVSCKCTKKNIIIEESTEIVETPQPDNSEEVKEEKKNENETDI